MRQETVKTDLTVIGGGLAGVCAAVAAARLGHTVALVNNRPVLGGNSSSEVRVWVCGATGHGTHRYARETGIMGEMFVENQYTNPEGNPYYWDLVVHETVKRETNIQLFLNTDVHEVEADGDEDERRIRSVTGWMMGSERRIRLESEVYLDCTGDGLVGFLAGAKYRLGREARSEFNEDWAPEAADDITLGSTLLFYTKDAGKPVKYVKPSFAIDVTQTTIPLRRVIRSGDNGCAYWWIEWGGELDTVHDNERIRDELWAVIYGIWDYIKNSGQFDSEQMTLEWVGTVPGKREYRRFVGDYMLNQNDIIAQQLFEDRVAYGGWSIDLHPPQGVYSEESGSKHLHADGNYHIPFRSLYSVNVSNMLMAGRNMSATHVAFGTTRVMATCAVIGEAAGTGAALCVKYGISPRDVYHDHLEELQQTLLRQDASVLGLRNADPLDQARLASVKSSSTMQRIAIEHPVQPESLDADMGILFPVHPSLDVVELLLDAKANTSITVELYATGKPQNYVPHERITSCTVEVAAGQLQWVRFNIQWKPASAQNAFLVVKAAEGVALYRSNEPFTGVLCFRKGCQPIVDRRLEDQPQQPVLQWSTQKLDRQPLCFRVTSPTLAYSEANVLNGYTRPYGGPNMWRSERLNGKEAFIELSWPEPMAMSEIHLTWNDEVNEDLINLHHHRTPFDIIPELAKNYRLEAWVDDSWTVVLQERDNRKRKRVHRLEQRLHTAQLRVIIEETNGAPCAELIEVRVYA
ncbi:FAD-dependent oxidoreductase [Paenibacillus sp. YYML68]|uniref:FAD-dependent oxidoreductase n=1 Tax=Paenibacillus sp. YYML68 TaxID=2909250 RepID=UPI00248FA63D|nr:FAD-dependent oxidoreductase [Paenibacillus sp. YYML68]